jgi:hypothetical protein
VDAGITRVGANSRVITPLVVDVIGASSSSNVCPNAMCVMLALYC